MQKETMVLIDDPYLMFSEDMKYDSKMKFILLVAILCWSLVFSALNFNLAMHSYDRDGLFFFSLFTGVFIALDLIVLSFAINEILNINKYRNEIQCRKNIIKTRDRIIDVKPRGKR